VPPYEALRVVVGTDIFLTTALSAALAWVFWRAAADDSFRELDFGATGDESLMMDEAYSSLVEPKI
jgi:hypothetical protein